MLAVGVGIASGFTSASGRLPPKKNRRVVVGLGWFALLVARHTSLHELRQAAQAGFQSRDPVGHLGQRQSELLELGARDLDRQLLIRQADDVDLVFFGSVEDFLWDRSQVLGLSRADSEGRFQIEALLPRGDAEDDPILYSVLVRAEGYLPRSADGVAVGPSTDSPVTINVALTHN